MAFDVDWVVIGSGFGGSVAALRLAEKGHAVLVLEQGRRWRDEDFAQSAWETPKAQWLPQLGMRGIMKITPFRHVNVLTGVGVGGGSLTWANTSYVPHSDAFYRHRQWAELADWRAELEPHYATARHMLGVVEPPFDGPSERLMAQLAEDLGVPGAHRTTPVAVFLGEPGVEVEDPYFGGEGPRRAGCMRCGQCILGCRHNAKNTLEKNYLWFAERRGARIEPERRVLDVRPLGAADGSEGYRVEHVATPPARGAGRRVVRARGVVLAGGTLGTNELLLRCRERGSLSRLSPRLGHLVRTNSETITAATAFDPGADWTTDVTITASIYPDEHTHITNNTYGEAGDGNAALFVPLVGDGTRTRRLRKLAGAVLRRPRIARHAANPLGWSRRTVIFTTMQSVDSSLRLVLRRRRLGRGLVMDTAHGEGDPPSVFLPVANRVAALAARRMGGYAQSTILDVGRAVPSTAHFLGGCVIGASPATGVVDARRRAFGYENLLIVDGSTVPANPGVNPSLTITALAEHALAQVPAAAGDGDQSRRGGRGKNPLVRRT
jgi:cholesterol oxidase